MREKLTGRADIIPSICGGDDLTTELGGNSLEGSPDADADVDAYIIFLAVVTSAGPHGLMDDDYGALMVDIVSTI
jgi:hypothetical protein